jgi:hypothetical protein
MADATCAGLFASAGGGGAPSPDAVADALFVVACMETNDLRTMLSLSPTALSLS